MEGKYIVDTYMYTKQFFALDLRNYDLVFELQKSCTGKNIIFQITPITY